MMPWYHDELSALLMVVVSMLTPSERATIARYVSATKPRLTSGENPPLYRATVVSHPGQYIYAAVEPS